MSPRHRAPARKRGSEHGHGAPAERDRRLLAPARTIRARLGIILALPTALLIALAGLGVAGRFRVAADAGTAVSDIELILAVQDLVHSLQRERGVTSGLLGGAGQYRPQVDAQRRASDRARAALDRRLGDTGGAVPRAVREALGRLGTLGAVRGSIDAGRTRRAAALDYYTAAVTALNTVSADASAGREDRTLRLGLEALGVLGEAKEATALERGHLNGVFAAGRFTQDDYLRFAQVRAAKLDALARFRRVAAPRRAAALEGAERTPQAIAAAAYEQRALDGAAGQRLRLAPARWWAAMTTLVDDLRTVQHAIGEDVRARALRIEAGARRTLALYAGAAAATLVTAVLLWLYAFGSIVRPLRLLAAEGHETAERRLPAAVARIQAAEDPGSVVPDLPRSRLTRRADEFADVAEALDDLQRTAVRLAAEQAVMRHNTAESLANLGRRNQNLVRRQLGFISALEREEEDPGALANLFELDHLATRMRRNAESLLVLVGEHSPRRATGTVPVGDVLRAAFAEVEDYRRVLLRRADEAAVKGTVAAEIAHLLAELVENALTFSPPDREVEVHARSDGSSYHIAIVDQGLGMDAEAMATANARLRGEQSFLVAPARDLGHYVVGRLAERLGIKVWLHDSPLNGVTARIALPGSVLAPAGRPAPEPVAAMAAPPPSGGTPERAAAAAAPAPAADPPDDVATTRNGLAKRRPREGALRRPQRPAPPPEHPPHAEPERTPDQVRSMLDAFRSGVHRATEAGPPARPRDERTGER
ncbi:sensor histidine kinase [Actinomadura macrotermitis]|uniref:histidine kinase n=1 Tax=Actinomadura macrotermitis TaxID=2585200 RepID=A0A7K0BXH2_9ACTN|nr:nitrate- and nitrite sensing domain-containing protein [Actinomadura macrotermitis]MQY05885.1 hypothetical protein [Actinomadura macrotermitis]